MDESAILPMAQSGAVNIYLAGASSPGKSFDAYDSVIEVAKLFSSAIFLSSLPEHL